MARINSDVHRVRFPGLWLWIYAPLFLALIGFGIWAVRVDRDFSFYWRDPAAITNTGPWIGLFSNVGVFIWWMAGVVSVFTAIVIWRTPGQQRNARFLLCWGLLTGFLALDDFFMIHEWVVPTYLSLSDDFLFAVYAVIALTLLIVFREEILNSPYPILALALGLFGVSIAVDLIDATRLLEWGVSIRLVWNLEYIVEDGLKLAGQVAWLHYFGLTCFMIMRTVLHPSTEAVSIDEARQRAKVG